jgi:hypothetical protein
MDHEFTVAADNFGWWMLKMLLSMVLTPVWIILEMFEVPISL